MDILPGIDLLDGKCVCAIHRSFAKEATFSQDPVEIAETWAEQGARLLYVADLDGARMGEPKNLKAVKAIIKSAKVPVYLGGGIRTVDTAKRLLDLGVEKIVVGTTAALDNNLAKEIFGKFADRTIVSIASLNGYVAVRDWQARTDERAEVFAKRMRDLGAKRIVFTDVSRKGMQGGANVISVKRVAKSIDLPLISAGGVSSLEDIKRLKALEEFGLEGVVVVTAIYSGTIKLSDAIALADSSD